MLAIGATAGRPEDLLDQAFEHLPIRCLGIEQVLDPLLLVATQLEDGLMLGLVEVGEGRDEDSMSVSWRK